MTFMNEIFAEKVEETTEAQTGALTLEAELAIVDGAEAQYQLAEAELATYERAHDEMVSISREAEEAIADNTMTPVLFKQINARLRYVTEGGLGQSKELTTEAELDAEITLTQEGVMEGIKKVWEAIKRGIAKVWQTITDFFAKLFGGAKKVRENLEKTLEKLEKATDDFDDKEIAVTTGAERLQMDGKLEVAKVTPVFKTLEGLKKGLGNPADIYKAMASQVLTDNADIEKFNKEMEKKGGQVVSEVKKVASKVLPGGKLITTTSESQETNAKGGDVQDALVSVPSIKVTDAKVTNMKDANAKGAKADVIALVKAAIDAAKVMENDKTVEDTKKARKDAVDAADKLADAAEKGKLSTTWTKAKVSMALRAVQKGYISGYQKLTSYEFGVIRGVDSFASAAAGKLKTGDK